MRIRLLYMLDFLNCSSFFVCDLYFFIIYGIFIFWTILLWNYEYFMSKINYVKSTCLRKPSNLWLEHTNGNNRTHSSKRYNKLSRNQKNKQKSTSTPKSRNIIKLALYFPRHIISLIMQFLLFIRPAPIPYHHPSQTEKHT